MSYIEETLTEGEKPVLYTKLHWTALFRGYISYMPSIIITVLVIAAVYFLFYKNNLDFLKNYYMDYIKDQKKIIDYIIIAGLIIACLALVSLGLKNLIYYMTTEVGLTNKRIFIKYGFISRITDETFINKIEGVDVRQSITGRLLNFGHLTVTATGGSITNFFYIPNPLLFRSKIQEQIGKT